MAARLWWSINPFHDENKNHRPSDCCSNKTGHNPTRYAPLCLTPNLNSYLVPLIEVTYLQGLEQFGSIKKRSLPVA